MTTPTIVDSFPSHEDPCFEPGTLIQKRAFRLPELTLECGHVLRDVRMGYETYGHLNATRDNAILIAHYFNGTSHCAGRYSHEDAEPGYWDSVIGPGKAFDTDRYFILSIDTLCNINAKDPMVVTTGPTSIDPKTGKPYGASFPIITPGDWVNAQKGLVDALGIRMFHAVAGPSMGGLQAMEWAARYPEMVDRVICAISAGLEVEPYLIGMIDGWMAPILVDGDFQNGNYHGTGREPITGLMHALKLASLNALYHQSANRLFRRRWARSDKDPAASLENQFAITATLERGSRERASVADANSFLRQARAVQLFSIKSRIERLRAPFLLLPAKSDLLIYPAYSARAAEQLREAGVPVEISELEGTGGHLDGVTAIQQASDTIRTFLDR